MQKCPYHRHKREYDVRRREHLPALGFFRGRRRIFRIPGFFVLLYIFAYVKIQRRSLEKIHRAQNGDEKYREIKRE